MKTHEQFLVALTTAPSAATGGTVAPASLTASHREPDCVESLDGVSLADYWSRASTPPPIVRVTASRRGRP